MRVTRKTRLSELLGTFPDVDDAFDLNDIDVSNLHADSTLAQLCADQEIVFEDLLAVILEALGGELDPDDDELEDFDEDDPDEESDALEGLSVPGFEDEEEDDGIDDMDLLDEDDDDLGEDDDADDEEEVDEEDLFDGL